VELPGRLLAFMILNTKVMIGLLGAGEFAAALRLRRQ
jgi:hypothetical protein